MARARQWVTYNVPSTLVANDAYTGDFLPGLPAGNTTLLRTRVGVHAFAFHDSPFPDPWSPFISHSPFIFAVATEDLYDVSMGDDWMYVDTIDKVLYSPMKLSTAVSVPPYSSLGFAGEYDLHWDLQPGTDDSKAMRKSGSSGTLGTWYFLGPGETGTSLNFTYTCSIYIRQLYEYDV